MRRAKGVKEDRALWVLCTLSWLASFIFVSWKWLEMLCTVVLVQLPSCVRLFATPWTTAHQASLPGFPVLHYLPELAQTHVKSAMHPTISSCQPLLLLPSIFPSIRVFWYESVLRIRWQSIGASASVLSMNIHGWFHLGLIGLISWLSSAFELWCWRRLLHGETLSNSRSYVSNFLYLVPWTIIVKIIVNIY